MNRREALKNLGILTGGIVLLPSCNFSQEKVAFAINSFKVSEEQVKLIQNIVDTLIPKTETPGALELKVDEFVWVMMKDCIPEKSQDQFLSGMQKFEENSKKVIEKPFNTSDASEREIYLRKAFDETSTENEDEKLFLGFTKNIAILGYMQSEYIMTKEMPYTLIPGSYGLCETIDNSKKINANA
jgi:hypothetical protein